MPVSIRVASCSAGTRSTSAQALSPLQVLSSLFRSPLLPFVVAQPLALRFFLSQLPVLVLDRIFDLPVQLATFLVRRTLLFAHKATRFRIFQRVAQDVVLSLAVVLFCVLHLIKNLDQFSLQLETHLPTHTLPALPRRNYESDPKPAEGEDEPHTPLVSLSLTRLIVALRTAQLHKQTRKQRTRRKT